MPELHKKKEKWLFLKPFLVRLKKTIILHCKPIFITCELSRVRYNQLKNLAWLHPLWLGEFKHICKHPLSAEGNNGHSCLETAQLQLQPGPVSLGGDSWGRTGTGEPPEL